MKISQKGRSLKLEVVKNLGIKTIFLSGNFTYKTGTKFYKEFENCVENSCEKLIKIELNGLENLDYSAALFLRSVAQKFGVNFNFESKNEKIKQILAQIFDENIDISVKKTEFKESLFSAIGRKIITFVGDFWAFMEILGEFVLKTPKIIKNFANLKLGEISNQIKTSGINAVFIVCLTSFLMGVVFVYIGSEMLSKFGANIFIVEIMGMLTLRELAPMVAAIILAGRSASSFSAQIGVMKLTQEIDAMKTMGFDSFFFLTLPRVIAMMILTPFVIFLADLISILGQMLVCDLLLEISIYDYLDRFREMIELRHFLVGMIKAPIYGAIIAFIGCMRGYMVAENTQSIGKFTTMSVVDSIFLIIATDAAFAIIFLELGL